MQTTAIFKGGGEAAGGSKGHLPTVGLGLQGPDGAAFRAGLRGPQGSR